MAIPVVEQLKQEIKDQPHQPLRADQVIEYTAERDRLSKMIQAPPWQSGPDRGRAAGSARRIDKMLQEQAPREITNGLQKDKVAKLANEVLETVIKPSQLTHAEMRRNPAGAVDAYIRREGSPACKDAILTFRRAMRALDPTNTDRDYTNVERYRRSGTGNGTASHMADAQIPGNFAYGALAKDNWPLGDATADNPLAQAKRREMSPEQKQKARERMAAARARKAEKLAAQTAAAASAEALTTEMAAVDSRAEEG